MSDLAEFLRARLDEAWARAWAIHDVGRCDALLYEEDMPGAAARTPDCDCGYPARILREVEAKRAIMAEHYPGTPWAHDAPEGLKICAGEECDGDTWQMATRWPCLHIRILAGVYSDHPDYRQEWKP